jgi:K+-transporting ATPase ATPase C chain
MNGRKNMNRHITSNVWLLALTLLICSVVYPGVLWGVGQLLLHDKANGSLIKDKEGHVIGSHLIAQPFAGDEYFQPRPSAVSYNAAATGGSNLGPNNPALRKRVVGMLGQIVKYRDGKPVGPDIVAWVRKNLDQDRAVLSKWIAADGNLAERWGGANSEFLKKWELEHKDSTAKWRSENPDAADVPPAVLAGLFIESYIQNATVVWPQTDGKDVQAAFFELWWKEHPQAAIEPVPSDLVLASGAGLDPHITLQSALYQLDRVATKRAEMSKRVAADVRRDIETLLRQQASAPLGGLVGVEMVNVLEVNLALQERFGS